MRVGLVRDQHVGPAAWPALVGTAIAVNDRHQLRVVAGLPGGQHGPSGRPLPSTAACALVVQPHETGPEA